MHFRLALIKRDEPLRRQIIFQYRRPLHVQRSVHEHVDLTQLVAREDQRRGRRAVLTCNDPSTNTWTLPNSSRVRTSAGGGVPFEAGGLSQISTVRPWWRIGLNVFVIR